LEHFLVIARAGKLLWVLGNSLNAGFGWSLRFGETPSMSASAGHCQSRKTSLGSRNLLQWPALAGHCQNRQLFWVLGNSLNAQLRLVIARTGDCSGFKDSLNASFGRSLPEKKTSLGSGNSFNAGFGWSLPEQETSLGSGKLSFNASFGWSLPEKLLWVRRKSLDASFGWHCQSKETSLGFRGISPNCQPVF
jgi:hypothetical protein